MSEKLELGEDGGRRNLEEVVRKMERALSRMELLQGGVVPGHLDEAELLFGERNDRSQTASDWAAQARGSDHKFFVSSSAPQKKSALSFYFKVALAFIAIIPPVTAATAGLVDGWWEHRLEQAKHDHEIRIGYLDRALDLERPYESRKLLLDFIALSETGALQNWATGERTVVEEAREERIGLLQRRLQLALSIRPVGCDADGQESVNEAAQETLAELAEAIKFKWLSTALPPSSGPTLNAISSFMLEREPNICVRIEGHVTREMRDNANVNISEERALVIRDALVELGVASNRVDYLGWGADGAFAEPRIEIRVIECDPVPH